MIRSGFYIGMGGPDVDERAFNQLRQIPAAPDPRRARRPDAGEFKAVLREQFFALMLDPEGALAAIPEMLADATARRGALAVIRAVVSAAGELTGERAKRLARIEAMLGEPAAMPAPDA